MICYDCTRSTAGHCWRHQIHLVNAAAGAAAVPTYWWTFNANVGAANNAAAVAPPGWNPHSWVWWNDNAGAAPVGQIYTMVLP